MYIYIKIYIQREIDTELQRRREVAIAMKDPRMYMLIDHTYIYICINMYKYVHMIYIHIYICIYICIYIQVANAMRDPEIQQILQDPVINNVLKNLQENPSAAQDALKDPVYIYVCMYHVM